MKRWCLPLSVLVVLGGTLLAAAKPTYGCSYFGDLVEDSEVIVAGRFTGWELDTKSGGEQFYDPKQTGGLIVDYAGIRANMLVDRVFKGDVPSEITVSSRNTLSVYDHEPKYVWIGPVGACGAFGSDPTGKYAVIGLSREDDGSFGAFIFSWFYAGDDPPQEHDYDGRSLGRLTPLFPGHAPGSPPRDFPIVPAMVAAVFGPIAFLAGAANLWRRSG